MNNNSFDSVSSNDDELGIFDYPNLTGSPERRLILAVLERAMLDYVGNDEQEHQSAKSWLFSEPGFTSKEFSFPWVCEHLDLSPVDIQRKIMKMPRRGSQRLAPWYTSPSEYSTAA